MSRRSGIPTPTQRRQRVAELAETHTRRELAALLDVSPCTIGNDLHALNLTAKAATPCSRRVAAERDARRAQLRTLAPMHTQRELCALLGVSDHTLHRDLRALNLTTLGARRATRHVTPAERQARRQRVRELSPTHTFRELLEELGVARGTLRKDLKALGIRAKPAVRGGRHPPQRLPPDKPQAPHAPPPRVGPRPQAKWCPRHPGVRITAWGCRACNAQRDQGWEGDNNRG